MEKWKKFSSFFCFNGRYVEIEKRLESKIAEVEDAQDALTICEPEPKTFLVKYDKNLLGGLKKGKTNISNENTGIKTFGEALRHFDLLPSLKQLEKSLKDVRRHKKTRQDHEWDVKQFDKEILKLCHEHHPDRVKNRGGTGEDMEAAKNMQACLNAMRTAVSSLSKLYLDHIGVEHMYGFCKSMSISSIENEDKVKQHVKEVFYEISYVSEIKQQEIIPTIREFLSAAKTCLGSFVKDKVPDFEKHRDAALSHLRNCIMGYRKLRAELEAVETSVRGKSLDKSRELIKKMSDECAKDLDMLREVENVAKESLNGPCKIFCTRQPVDDYFVSPFVEYVNNIAVCNWTVKKENKSVSTKLLEKMQNADAYKQLGIDYKLGVIFSKLFYIGQYLSGDRYYENRIVKEIKKKWHWREKSEDESMKDEKREKVKPELINRADENMKDEKPEAEKLQFGKSDESIKDEKLQDDARKDVEPEVVKREDEYMKDEKLLFEKSEDDSIKDEKLKDEKSEDDKREVVKRENEDMKYEKLQDEEWEHVEPEIIKKEYVIPEVVKREDEKINREKVKKLFRKHLKEIMQNLEEKYKEENYVGHTSSFADDYTECLRMMAEFNEKEKKMREGIEELNRKHEDIEEMLENMFKKSSEVSNETKCDVEEEPNNS